MWSMQCSGARYQEEKEEKIDSSIGFHDGRKKQQRRWSRLADIKSGKGYDYTDSNVRKEQVKVWLILRTCYRCQCRGKTMGQFMEDT